MSKPTCLALATLALIALTGPLGAQTETLHRTILQDVPFPAGYHSATVRIVLDKGATAAAHSHPGIEMGYVLDGKAELTIKGQPAKALAAGDSFAVPANAVHTVVNTGPGALTMVSTYVVEKDKPLATPAP
jgi:quercetin dioxygenase-like cupin family protein